MLAIGLLVRKIAGVDSNHAEVRPVADFPQKEEHFNVRYLAKLLYLKYYNQVEILSRTSMAPVCLLMTITNYI